MEGLRQLGLQTGYIVLQVRIRTARLCTTNTYKAMRAFLEPDVVEDRIKPSRTNFSNEVVRSERYFR